MQTKLSSNERLFKYIIKDQMESKHKNRNKKGKILTQKTKRFPDAKYKKKKHTET